MGLKMNKENMNRYISIVFQEGAIEKGRNGCQLEDVRDVLIQ